MHPSVGDMPHYIGMVAGIVAGGLLIELSLPIFIEPIESPPLLLLLQPATASSNATPRDEIRI